MNTTAGPEPTSCTRAAQFARSRCSHRSVGATPTDSQQALFRFTEPKLVHPHSDPRSRTHGFERRPPTAAIRRPFLIVAAVSVAVQVDAGKPRSGRAVLSGGKRVDDDRSWHRLVDAPRPGGMGDPVTTLVDRDVEPHFALLERSGRSRVLIVRPCESAGRLRHTWPDARAHRTCSRPPPQRRWTLSVMWLLPCPVSTTCTTACASANGFDGSVGVVRPGRATPAACDCDAGSADYCRCDDRGGDDRLDS